MWVRLLAAAAIALGASLVARPACAWQEAHEVGADFTVRVEMDGRAVVDDVVQWHVVRGPLRSFDLSEIPTEAAIDATVGVSADDGRTYTARAARQPTGAVRVTIDDARGLARGTFRFDVRWRVDLVATGALERDGTTWRLTVAEPPALEGFDAAKTIVDVPSAPEAPTPIVAETGASDDAALATVRRTADRDVLEIARPHVSRGESVGWTLRLDARAVAALQPQAGPKGEATNAPAPRRDFVMAVVPLALALAFGALVFAKSRRVARASASLGAPPRGLVPMPASARAVAAGAAFGAALVLDFRGAPAAGGVCVAVATLLSAWRPPRTPPRPRGPGRWLVLRPSDAFASPPRTSDFLDAKTPGGRKVVALAMLVAAGVALISGRISSDGPWMVAMATAPLVPLFSTGAFCAAEALARSARWLARVHARLARDPRLHAVPWARMTLDGAVDEMRVLVLPRGTTPGLVGIEVGLAAGATATGTVGLPEVLVRVLDASAAFARLTSSIAGARSVPGRRPDERVVRLTPAAPTVQATASLARELALALADRRATADSASPDSSSWTGRERRTRTAVPRLPVLAPAVGPGLC